jgi:iron complex transport system substrate-binding protein
MATMLRTAFVAIALLAGSSLPSFAQPWTYTGGNGETVSLDAPPVRIIAHQDAAAGLIPLGIRPVGIYADSPVAEAKALEGLDLTGIEIIGTVWSEVDIEKAAALRPDLIIGEWWVRTGEWSGGAAPAALLTELAPLTGVAASDSIVGMIEDYEALAESLGADLDLPEIATDTQAFEAARADFEAAVAAKPDLTALAVYAGEDALYVADPAGAAELLDLRAWGLDIISPEGTDATGNNYFETVSWENADRYPADLILVDNRSASTMETALAQPTWTLNPGAAAGQVADWPAYWVRNSRAFAGALDELTAAVEAADPTVAP